MRTDAFSLNTTQVLNSDNSGSLSRLSANKITQGAAACSNRIPDFSKLNHQPLNLVEATNGRGGAYPAASDIARYEILHQRGGIYTDVDLECKQTLAFDKLKSHPDLVLVGMAASKKEEAGSVTPYFANALIASHQGSKLISDLIGDIKEEYDSIKGNDFSGTRYFARPNKATIERTGPNKLREQVSVTLNRPQTDINSKSMRIWDNGILTKNGKNTRMRSCFFKL